MNKQNLLFYYGQEDFLIEEAVRQLIPSQSMIQRFTLRRKEMATFTQSLLLWASPSLFGEPEYAVIDGKRFFQEKWDASDSVTLRQVLTQIPAHATTLFLGETIEAKNALGNWLKKHAVVKRYDPFSPWQERVWINWIKARVHQAEKKITDQDAQYLKLLAGSNLRTLSKEIEKLALYLGERQTIEKQDIEAIISPGLVQAFAFVDAVREKRLVDALRCFRRLQVQGESLFSLFHFLMAQFRPLYLMIRGETPSHVHPYVLKKNREAAKRFRPEQLARCWEEARHLDLLFKTHTVPAAAFESLLISFCA